MPHPKSTEEPVSLVKSADHLLQEVKGPGVPTGIHGAACVTCAEESPLFDDDALPVAVWTVQHTQRTAHTRFLFRTEKHWRVVRREDRETEPEGPPAAGGSFAGPAFVGLMCLLTAASGLLPLLTS